MDGIDIGGWLGEYRILRQVGMGGMATVYCAYHHKTERDVAVKVIHQALTRDPSVRERFVREARLTAKLEHPHLLPVYEYSITSNPAYIVMRYVDGGSLQDRINKGPISCDETARILEMVSSALDFAHRHGVIHRDVKPSNILFDHEGHVYVTDFGIARINDTDAPLELTGIGHFVGTPSWMAPEQFTGRDPIDNRTDVYALGVTLFQMLTGQLPYVHARAMDILLKHINDPVPRASQCNPSLPPDLDNIIAKAMAKRPVERYGSTAELLRAYREVLDHGRNSLPQKYPSLHTQPAPAPVAPPKPVNKKALFEKYPGIWTTLENEEIEAGYMAKYGVGPRERTEFDDHWRPVQPDMAALVSPEQMAEQERRGEAVWDLIKHRFEYAEGAKNVSHRVLNAALAIEFGTCVDGVYTFGRVTLYPNGKLLYNGIPATMSPHWADILGPLLRGEKFKYSRRISGTSIHDCTDTLDLNV